LKHRHGREGDPGRGVAPYAGAWIETLHWGNGHAGDRSLPTRERGLKQRRAGIYRRLIGSLPTRERGLKLMARCAQAHQVTSLPTRERGLKLGIDTVFNETCDVAPYAGAWIETLAHLPSFGAVVVAPYAGAWIETVIDPNVSS